MTSQDTSGMHWHYATTMPSRRDRAVIEPQVSAETDLDKDAAKRVLQPMIRQIQGAARYEDPDDPATLWEPADWWIRMRRRLRSLGHRLSARASSRIP